MRTFDAIHRDEVTVPVPPHNLLHSRVSKEYYTNYSDPAQNTLRICGIKS